ncbi:hypothetical protein [Patulibacter sp. SYSU D01012]|uniref:hypothetical protein n=1 Tax=Patulibacter sp. SYSU D01012 TaxID=2817381 RepID=UPI001B30DE4A|nr:hypothetical protein [Patulibacter sp. SYSU D01012]
MSPQTSPALDAFLRGVDRHSDLRATLLGARADGPDDAGAGRPELRPAHPDDALVLAGIARRDPGARMPAEPVLVAVVAGTPIAAIGLGDRRVIADPDWPTMRAVDALQAAAARWSPWPGRLARLRAALARVRGHRPAAVACPADAPAAAER